MKTCPACGNQAAEYLVTNVQDASKFGAGCAPATFMSHYVLTCEDVKFFMACGIDAELGPKLTAMLRAELQT
jgi:hypothetical protein